MSSSILFVCLIAGVIAVITCNAEDPATMKTPRTLTSSTSTSAKPTSHASRPHKTTTATKPTTTATKPTTTATKPTTTTTKPTTKAKPITMVTPHTTTNQSHTTVTHAHENSTTERMTTTHTRPTTPTITTTPAPKRDPWAVKDKKGNVCILLNADINLVFRVDEKNVTTVNVGVPYNSSVSGSCGVGRSVTEEDITLTFFENWNLTLKFSKDSTNNSYKVSQLSVYYDSKTCPKIKQLNDTRPVGPVGVSALGGSKVGGYFQCDKEVTIYNNTNGNETLILVEVSKFKMDAFRENNNRTEFETKGGFDCNSESPSHKKRNLVGIIVGCVLGALLLIVIVIVIACCCCKGRRSATGYQPIHS